MKGLEYIKEIDGLPVDPRWKGERGGKEVLFKRVVAGVALPKPDQPQGAVVVLAERYAQEGPPTFEALGARVGLWPDLEPRLRALRRALKVEIFVVAPDDDQAMEALRRVPGLREAAGSVPHAVLPAPAHAAGELGRQRVNRLLGEGRLILKPVQAVLDAAAEPAAEALQYVVGYLLARKARYGRRDDLRAAGKRRARSYVGRRSGPDEPKPIPAPTLPTPRAGDQIIVSADGKHSFGHVGGGLPRWRRDIRARNEQRRRSTKLRVRDFKREGRE